jgi:hypothetical protein
MKKDEKCDCHCHHKKMGGGSAVYCLGFIGAAVYFIGTAATFGIGVLGFLKAIVWPAFLVYAAMKYLGM